MRIIKHLRFAPLVGCAVPLGKFSSTQRVLFDVENIKNKQYNFKSLLLLFSSREESNSKKCF